MAVVVAPAPSEEIRGLEAHRAAAIAEGPMSDRLQDPMEPQIRVVAPVAALVEMVRAAREVPAALPSVCT